MHPTPSKKIPVGPQWLHELKHDGYRLVARRIGDRGRLFTRGGYDWTDRYPRMVGALDDLRVKSAPIDGEVVVCRPNGKPDFDKLHSRVLDRVAVMIAFDLIELNGEEWAAAPLEERKLRLAQLLRLSTDIHYNEVRKSATKRCLRTSAGTERLSCRCPAPRAHPNSVALGNLGGVGAVQVPLRHYDGSHKGGQSTVEGASI